MGEIPICNQCYELGKQITDLKLTISIQVERVKDLEDRVNSFKKK